MRFHALSSDRVVVTNLVGEHVVLPRAELDEVVTGGRPAPATITAMRARQMIRAPEDTLPLELLAMKLRTQKRRLAELTSLHMFVVTLRCEHTCRYCQVSRQATGRGEFDMTQETAEAALGHVFASPSQQLKIEFQGGESLLNFDLIKWVVLRAEQLNHDEQRDLAFVIATNLALVDDEMLDFCAEHQIVLSTSLDGPADLHNHNRRRPGQDSWQRAVEGIRRVTARLGPDYVSALMTTTEESLDQPEAIINSYAELGLTGIFLRPISPYGFALRLRGGGRYDTQRWLEFYRRGLAHIIELNRAGTPMTEIYAAIIAKKMFTNDDPGYVDLTSPAGIGIGGIVYNYDGGIYACDEGRMLAETGDQTFRLGTVHDSWADIMGSHKLLDPLWESFTLSVPGCDQCAFEPWCGADPTFHHATQNDFAGHKALSAFCARNTGIFTYLVELADSDSFVKDLLYSWAHR
ncbi:His-Xaa-Ser system radical SAM maturase HxsB [Nocardioides mangrovicus]|uniref:His-Xaa-Ser system radical SAM maturase HxsB n=2 Tax=Nocardioides mangrovicus TaxID=2478913 RepID=A0A3L8P6M8_9ACTN|nr:His-Xaa-Ser system radical SAM maturase HxsB [Nocardioides mangrovicus]